jgi:cephalosporin-C deacetylase-like acetyl esterase
MSAAEVEVYEDTENERILRWRARELERAGYGDLEIAELAARVDVDLHLAVSLLERGCPPDTALRILL